MGKTIHTPAQGRENLVARVSGANVYVVTDESSEAEPVSLAKLQQGIDLLLEDGEVRIAPETFDNYRRSSFIGAALAAIPGTLITDRPVRVLLAPQTPLRDGLQRATELVTQPRTTEKVTSGDPLHQLMVHELPGLIRPLVGDPQGFKVQGSAGQVNLSWAETPWVSVFDRLVTESAQRGHYVVYLVHPGGQGIYLSLNQAVTEAGQSGGGRPVQEVLAGQAARLRNLLPAEATDGLILSSLDLAGAGYRTRGYEAGNVAGLYYPADAIPHDAVLAHDLSRFLRLYDLTTTGLDAEDAGSDSSTPESARVGLESRRYRWHLRAEGRNGAVAKRAKQLQGYTCCVCDRDFVTELGELGKRCIDAHHLTPFAELDERPRKLDPRNDFAIVCANCHRMIHSETPPLSPIDLRARLNAHS